MDNKSELSIYFFLLGAVLCLLPILCLPWMPSFGISLETASELIPSMAKVDHNQSIQLEMPVYLIRQSFLPFFTNLNPLFTHIFSWCSLIGILIFTYGIKKWAKINNIQFYIGLSIWLILALLKTLPSNFSSTNLIPFTSYLIPLNYTLFISFLFLIILSILSSQTIPHLILQFGRRKTYPQTKKTFLILYIFYVFDLLWGLYQQQAGDALNNHFMLSFLCLHWAIFWFQIVSNPILEKQKLLFLGIYMLAIPALLWFYFHQNDPAIRFVYEWNFRCMLIMGVLFPAFIYSNFKEIFSHNLALHSVVFKAHRIKLFLYQSGVLIIGLAWVFAKNATLYHVLLAGYYNQVGDIESLEKKPQIARISYQMAQGNSRLNLKSNFELARLSSTDEEKAQYLSYTLSKRAHPFTYLSLGNIYKDNDHPFQALFTFEEGFEKFPESAELANAIAIQYEKLNEAQKSKEYFEKAAQLAPDNASIQSNLLYAMAQETILKKKIPTGFEHDLAYQSNRMALYLLHQQNPDFEPVKEFQMAHHVQNFAYLYNSQLLFKGKAIKQNMVKLLQNEAIISTFPEIHLLDAWQAYFEGKRLAALQKISFLKETYAGKDANPYEQVFYFWHNTLNEPIKSLESLKTTPEQLLEKFPFSVELQNKYFPILNAQKKEKIAYDYALAAIQFNPNKAELYPNYILQAIQMSELEYAKEAMEKLKELDSKLYLVYLSQFEKKKKELAIQRSLW
ncbi:MAG: hypothetical protein RJA76_546 [Bacteroidota bacterium]|jgi:tetratricopeptide (TPR) repeat protein